MSRLPKGRGDTGRRTAAARGVSAVAIAATVCLAPVAGTATAADPPVLGGGSGIVVANQAECTLTTIGHDRAGRLVGLTAGHCGEPGATVLAEYNPNYGVVGRFAHSDPVLDYAVIEFDADRVTPARQLGDIAITGLGAPAQFPTVVCKKGRTTGTTCGVAWGDIGATSDTWTQLCVLEGDSGAPVLVGSTLVGMVNAYLGVGCFGPEVGTDIHAVVADLDARGEVGAGFQPI
ncbi:S1 family peptidase [Nocardia xishanensis]|uniref:S1 family peptidase n=1 Tax=Nocardia xishanensis TaxID=238964 RepID=UPI000A80C845|nr:S1 family peptidase [Nocardia xishanensis]